MPDLVDFAPRDPEPGRHPAAAAAPQAGPRELADVRGAFGVGAGEAAFHLALGEGGAHPAQRVEEDVCALGRGGVGGGGRRR